MFTCMYMGRRRSVMCGCDGRWWRKRVCKGDVKRWRRMIHYVKW